VVTIAGLKADILTFLQSFFAEGRLADPVDDTTIFKYDQDEEKTDLIIRSRNLVQDSELGRKPLIILDRGAITFNKSSLNQIVDYDPTTGKEHYMDIMSIPIVLHCIDKNDEQAELLALTAALSFYIQRTKFRPEWLHDFNLNAITPPSILINESQGEGSAVFVVSVNLIFYAHIGFHRWDRADKAEDFRSNVTEIVL
jgi:hypothetical protein